MSAREGAHSDERETAQTVVVGSVVQAASQRRRAQKGVAAAARRGQAAVLAQAAKSGKVAADVRKEVARAMKAGTALVQASLERLETAERSWDKFVKEGGHTRSTRLSVGRAADQVQRDAPLFTDE